MLRPEQDANPLQHCKLTAFNISTKQSCPATLLTGTVLLTHAVTNAVQGTLRELQTNGQQLQQHLNRLAFASISGGVQVWSSWLAVSAPLPGTHALFVCLVHGSCPRYAAALCWREVRCPRCAAPGVIGLCKVKDAPLQRNKVNPACSACRHSPSVKMRLCQRQPSQPGLVPSLASSRSSPSCRQVDTSGGCLIVRSHPIQGLGVATFAAAGLMLGARHAALMITAALRWTEPVGQLLSLHFVVFCGL